MRMVAGCSGHRLQVRDDDDNDVYKTVVLNIDERFLFERKPTPVENALFILLPHYTSTTTDSMLQYTARGTGVSRREDNIIYYQCVYSYTYIYLYRTRGRDRLFILDRLDIHPVLIRRISAAVATYIMYII